MKDSTDRFLSEAEVEEITNLSRSTRWRKERAGTFPRKHKISENRSANLHSEILAWIAAIVNGVTEKDAV